MRWDLVQGIFRALESGGGGSQSSNTTVQTKYSPEEEAQRNKVRTVAEGIYDKQSTTPSPYPGAKPVPFSAETTQAQNMLASAATGPGSELASNAAGAANFGTSGAVLSPTSNPYLSATADTATRKLSEAYQSPTGPLAQIRGQFTGANSGGSGTREGIAGGIAGRSYLNAVGDVTSDIYSKAYGQGLDYMKSSMAFSPQTYNLLMQPSLSMAAIGQQKEDLLGQQEGYAASSREYDISQPWQTLAPYANTVLGMQNPSTNTTANATAPKNSKGTSALSGAMMGAAVGSAIPGVGTLVGAGVGLLMGLM